MYFSVLNNHIPKMKFIAGDQTGTFYFTKATAYSSLIFVLGWKQAISSIWTTANFINTRVAMRLTTTKVLESSTLTPQE